MKLIFVRCVGAGTVATFFYGTDGTYDVVHRRARFGGSLLSSEAFRRYHASVCGRGSGIRVRIFPGDI